MLQNQRGIKYSQFYRDTWIQINLSNIATNLKQFRKKLPLDKKIYAVVKANAYGLGAIQISIKALSSGADALAVAILDQAIKLRNAGIKVPILVMGWSRAKDAPLAASLDISVTAFQKQWMMEAKNYQFNKKLKVHLKIDTGMGRLGVRSKQQLNIILEELKDQRFQFQGIFTHFSTTDQQQQQYYHKQNNLFKQFVDQIHNKWQKSIIIHSGNSAAAIKYPKQMYNYVRIGALMYGSLNKIACRYQLINCKQTLALYSRLIYVNLVRKGQQINSNISYQTSQDQWIGCIGIGYGDGYSRKLEGQDVLIQGKRMPIVGKICMDYTMIRLDKYYPIGTKVTLIGRERGQKIEVDEIANKISSVFQEITCLLSNRIPRIYVENQGDGNSL